MMHFKYENVCERSCTDKPLWENMQGGWIIFCVYSRRIVVFQHIPWFLNSADEADTVYFTLKTVIRKTWLDKFKDAGVEAIFCGHYHRNAGGSYRDMDVVTTSAIGGQLGVDKSGARIVKVLDNKIQHQYYAIEELPLRTEFWLVKGDRNC